MSSMNIVFLILGLIIAIVLVVVCVLLIKKVSKKQKQKDVSILDVNESGVPNNLEKPEFSYGYEKEPTIVMDPVNPNENVEEKKEVSPKTEVSEEINKTEIKDSNPSPNNLEILGAEIPKVVDNVKVEQNEEVVKNNVSEENDNNSINSEKEDFTSVN